MREVDYWVSKVKWDENHENIVSMMVHQNNNGYVATGEEKNRNWIVQKLQYSYILKCIYRTEASKWSIGSQLKLENTSLKWNNNLPLIQTKRKTFVSYYHKDNSEDKKNFLNLTTDLIVSKSVEDGDIKTDLSDEYVKQLIQKGFLSDTTVLVVLIGVKTKCRKHVDWEISGALNQKVGGNYSGLLGLLLPSHSDYGSQECTYTLIPDRLADNFKSKYAVIRDYTTDRQKLQEYIELAYNNRRKEADNRMNSRVQMKMDSCN
jgi:hypothetical protein